MMLPERRGVLSATGGQSVRAFEDISGNLLYGICWSPDGNWIAFSRGYLSARASLQIVPSSGGSRPAGLAEDIENVQSCGWAADGKSVYFPQTDGIHQAFPADKTHRLIIPRKLSARAPTGFSPDGTMFFFGHREDSSRMVTVLQLPGGREMKTVAIDLDPSLGILSFSPHPDGRRIAVAAGRLNYDLWMMEGFPQPATGVARLFRHWEVRAPSALSH